VLVLNYANNGNADIFYEDGSSSAGVIGCISGGKKGIFPTPFEFVLT